MPKKPRSEQGPSDAHLPAGQSAPKPRQLRRYARNTEILKAVHAVRDAGIAVTSIDLRPDGTIKLSSGNSDPDSDHNEFDWWNKAGKL